MEKKTIILGSSVVLLIVLMIIISILKTNITNASTRLKDSNKFFEINNLINQATSEYEDMSYSYMSKQIFYKQTDLITTYFVNGFVIKGQKEIIYNDNINYLIRVQGATYELEKLNNIDDIKTYANNYEETKKELNSELIIPTYEIEDQSKESNKLIYYLMVFQNLLKYNSNDAYNYLSDNMKDKYNQTTLSNNSSNIIINMPAYIESYTTNNDKSIYYLTLQGGKKVTIYEDGVMNFKIEF